jgi:hypothetical protein
MIDTFLPSPFLATLTAERICHDLAGLAGLLSGAIELAREDGGDEALTLAQEGARDMTARLRFLRASFGGAAGALDGAALLGLAAGLPGAERIRLSLDMDFPVLDEAAAPLVLLVLLDMASRLPRGGEILLTQAGGQIGISYVPQQDMIAARAETGPRLAAWMMAKARASLLGLSLIETGGAVAIAPGTSAGRG